MKETNNAVNIPVNKRCRMCNKLLPAAFFYKKTKSKDGLQDSCKDCQDAYFKQLRQKKSKVALEKLAKKVKTNANVSRATKLKRLSSYHLTYGLEYEIIGKLKKGKNREVVCYKCLTCGKEFTADFDTAWSYRFNCNECVDKIPGLPTSDLVKPNTFKYDTIRPWPKHDSKLSSDSNEDVCSHNCDECNCFEGAEEIQQTERDIILEKLKELRAKAPQTHMPHVHVIIVEVPKIQNVPLKVKKDNLWAKIKKFFHRS